MTRRLPGLEAVRGVAALVVTWTHAGAFVHYSTAAAALFEYGHLAVDLFFLLSGFVLARTYEHRMPGGTTFLKRRFVRLWGPVAAGVTIGGAYYALSGSPPEELWPNLAAGLAILPLVGGAILFNPPAWSIFFELVANFAHALSLKALSNRVLAVVIVLSGGVLLAGMGPQGLDVGFEDSLWLGIPRVLMSYCLGVLLWRMNGDRGRFGERAAWPVIAMYVAAIAVFPAAWLGATEIAFACFVHPAVLLAVLEMKESRFAASLGGFSFTLYALHFPVMMFAFGLGLQWWNALVATIAACGLLGLAIDRRFRAALANDFGRAAQGPGFALLHRR